MQRRRVQREYPEPECSLRILAPCGIRRYLTRVAHANHSAVTRALRQDTAHTHPQRLGSSYSEMDLNHKQAQEPVEGKRSDVKDLLCRWSVGSTNGGAQWVDLTPQLRAEEAR
jgi:hypothetical protein